MVHLIALHRDAILHRWAAAVRTSDAARGLDDDALVGLMPRYVGVLGHSDTEAGELSAVQRQLIERHVTHRLRQGFLLNDILTEFGMLFSSIDGVLAEAVPDFVPDHSARGRLRQELYLAMLFATDVFNEHMLEDEPLEKRLRRRIGDAATGAPRVLLSSEAPLERRLREMLELSMAAIGADVATLLVHDPAQGRLAAVASVGEARDPLERFIAAFEKDARPHTAVILVDAASVERDAGLRQAGIRSLMGVRVIIRGELAAVVYMGRRAPRGFSPSDVRKLEALADILAPQIDIVHLRSEIEGLTSRVEALSASAAITDPHAHALVYTLGASLAAARAEAARIVPGDVVPAAAVEALGHDLQRMERIITAWLDTRHPRHRAPV